MSFGHAPYRIMKRLPSLFVADRFLMPQFLIKQSKTFQSFLTMFDKDRQYRKGTRPLRTRSHARNLFISI